MSIKPRLGWVKQLPDFRDFKFKPTAPVAPLPSRVDLRSLSSPVVDQGDLGSCTGNAIAAVHWFAQMKQFKKAFYPSRLFIYYNERVIEGTVKEDAGATIRNGFKSIGQLGAARETCWKYDISKFARKPTKSCYTAAVKHTAMEYLSIVPTLSNLKSCLADGFPFVFGFAVFESLDSSRTVETGIVQMPSRTEQMLGGHAVTCVGYDDKSGYFIVQNSWGKEWGDRGFCYMPYRYLIDRELSADFWTLRLVK